MKVVISAESTIDLPKDLLDKYEIKTIPFSINFDGKLVEDGEGVSEQIYEFVSKTNILPKTSAVSPEQYLKYFEELKKEYDAIIHISLSSQMSCAYNNAKLIANEMDNVYVVDSKSLSTGIALLALYACDLLQKGLDVSDICKLVTEKTNSVNASFIIDNLKYLHKGGRCSSLALLGANVLKIKPRINVTNGKMGVNKKYIGSFNKVANKYTDDILSEMDNASKDTVFITHSSDMPEIQEMMKAKLEEKGFKHIIDTYAGGTICSHCGPNTIGILYLTK